MTTGRINQIGRIVASSFCFHERRSTSTSHFRRLCVTQCISAPCHTSSNVCLCHQRTSCEQADHSTHSQQAFIDIIHLISQASSHPLDRSSLPCLHTCSTLYTPWFLSPSELLFRSVRCIGWLIVFLHPQCAFISSSSHPICLASLSLCCRSLPHRRLLALQWVRNDLFLLFRSLHRAPSSPSWSLHKEISSQSPSLLDWFSTYHSFLVSSALLRLF